MKIVKNNTKSSKQWKTLKQIKIVETNENCQNK